MTNPDVEHEAPPVLSRPSGGRVDYARVRHAFSQLAEGVQALHDGGLLHRDLKPSNVLVTHEGRVVILDFGLAQESRPDDTQSVTVQGTPAYMSPEHASGLGTSEASDWYGVGVMLFEALTGQTPFRGSYLEVLKAKLEPFPPRPSDRARGVPRDLDALCHDLLHAEAAHRPGGRDVLARLGTRGREAQPAAAPSLSSRRGPTLVGRGRHLAALDEAFQASRGGQAEVVFVRGQSGMGKTALVRRFLRDVRQRDAHAVTLVGRCYERESVPYKALDTIVDAVAQHLKPLSGSEADAVLPRDVMALARLFPALREVEAVASGRHRHVEIPDAQELRRRAFGALRELLNRLSDRHPLVLFIDDMQWGDLDSCALLADLLEPPDPPALLLIVAYRSDEERNPVLQTLVSAMQRGHPAGFAAGRGGRRAGARRRARARDDAARRRRGYVGAHRSHRARGRRQSVLRRRARALRLGGAGGWSRRDDDRAPDSRARRAAARRGAPPARRDCGRGRAAERPRRRRRGGSARRRSDAHRAAPRTPPGAHASQRRPG